MSPLFKIALKAVLVTVVLSMIAGAIAGHWSEISAASNRVDLRWVAAAGGVYLIYTFLNAAVWGQVLTAISHPLNPLLSARIWIMTEALRWLPGSIWGYCSRVFEASRHGVPKRAASLSLTLELALTVAAWCAAAVVGASLSPFVGQLSSAFPVSNPGSLVVSIVAAAGCVLAIVAFFPDFRFSQSCRRAIRQAAELLSGRLRYRNLCTAFLAYLGLCFLQGAGLYLVVRSLGLAEPPSPLLVIAVNAIAWLAGFFAIGIPAGIGVREAALAGALSLAVPVEAAICAAVLWRAAQTVVEPICLAICAATARSPRLRGRLHPSDAAPLAVPDGRRSPSPN